MPKKLPFRSSDELIDNAFEENFEKHMAEYGRWRTNTSLTIAEALRALSVTCQDFMIKVSLKKL